MKVEVAGDKKVSVCGSAMEAGRGFGAPAQQCELRRDEAMGYVMD